MTGLRIARNDPALAHAAARGEVRNLRAGTALLIKRLERMTPKQGAVAVAVHFGPLVLLEQVTRVIGSRPKGRWLVLDAALDGHDLVLLRIEMDKYGWSVTEGHMRLSSHCVARLAQRTLGTADIRAAASVLRLHCAAALINGRDVIDGGTLFTCTADGALIWRRQAPDLYAATWLAADSMADPTLSALCQRSGIGIAARVNNQQGQQHED